MLPWETSRHASWKVFHNGYTTLTFEVNFFFNEKSDIRDTLPSSKNSRLYHHLCLSLSLSLLCFCLSTALSLFLLRFFFLLCDFNSARVSLAAAFVVLFRWDLFESGADGHSYFLWWCENICVSLNLQLCEKSRYLEISDPGRKEVVISFTKLEHDCTKSIHYTDWVIRPPPNLISKFIFHWRAKLDRSLDSSRIYCLIGLSLPL